MLEVRKSADRGHFDHGWLNTYHTFSFADYYDPAWVEYGPLRVINDDRVAAGEGFGKHGHRDMEIITYVLSGALAHADSMGNGSTIRAGDVQRMSAGTGITHSEFNASDREPVHFLQIWIKPEAARLAPSYEQKNFPAQEKRGRLRLIASHEGAEGSVIVHQDVRIHAGLFSGSERAEFELRAGRRAWLQIACGRLTADGTQLEAGDGARFRGPARLALAQGSEAEVLLFDMA